MHFGKFHWSASADVDEDLENDRPLWRDLDVRRLDVLAQARENDRSDFCHER